MLLVKDNSTATNAALRIDNNVDSAGIGFMVVYNSTGCCDDRFAKFSTTLNIGVWYHVAGVYDSSAQTETLYVNGVQVATFNAAGLPPETGAGGFLQIGAENHSTDVMNGTADDVRVYNRALSAAEVWQLFTAQ